MIRPLFGILWLISSVHCSGGGGESTTFRKQDDHGNYKFGYDINDEYGGNHFHKESGDEYGNKRGSYGILGPDGKMRIVHYIADEHGFRVDIKSNEQGLSHGKDSASTIVNGKDADEYSSTFGQRTPGYSPSSSLYLSSTSNHPSSSSKPYYIDSLSSKPDYYAKNTYSLSPTEETYPTSHNAYISTKPKSYSNYALAAKTYFPKNIPYVPKYNHYSKPVAYEAPSYSSPTYTSSSYGTGYEPSNYPTPIHKPTYSNDYSSSAYSSPIYGTRKTQYASDLYSKSAEPVLSYTKLSGYSSKKHNEKIKYFNEPYDHALSSATGVYEISKSPSTVLDTTLDNSNIIEKKKADEEVAASYRTEPKSGVISTKSNPKISALIGLTSYKNPFSIDKDYKSS